MFCLERQNSFNSCSQNINTYWVIEFHKSYSIWKDYIIALLLNMYINTHNCKTTCDSVSVKLYLEVAGKSTTTAGWAYLRIIQFMSSCSRESLSSAELHLIPSDRLLWSGWLLCVRNKIKKKKKKVISWIIKSPCGLVMANLKRLEVWFINNFVNWLDEGKKKKKKKTPYKRLYNIQWHLSRHCIHSAPITGQ